MSDVAMFKVLSARKSAMEERLLHGFCAGQRGPSGTRHDVSDAAQMSRIRLLARWRRTTLVRGAFNINCTTRKSSIKCSRRHLYTKV